MSMSDPIADMLTRIRNANSQRHATVDIPSSKMKVAIADILVKEGYVKSYEVIEDGVAKTMRVSLKYTKDAMNRGEKVISGLKRISKPGLRVYASKDKMPRVLNGLGTAIISTNKGLVTDKEARRLGVGGEIVAVIW
ncbi:MAG: 30S ribosomal protein S8 [Defluviitaleaceae bacterium]|nr:30S ribosomal protein S8 [Defluviitaleaceae bacterium]MCL2836673.1 30S ribosomal protein S8 [Defluviitaleaceae bacterium]